MLVFEAKAKNNLYYNRVLFIGDRYRAYEQKDGSVFLNDEGNGVTFHLEETYEEFRLKFPDLI